MSIKDDPIFLPFTYISYSHKPDGLSLSGIIIKSYELECIDPNSNSFLKRIAPEKFELLY